MDNLSIFEQLCFVCSRIEASNDKMSSTGTGFFFNLKIGEGKSKTLFVTNKHVVKGMTSVKFMFTEADSENNPIYGKTFSFEGPADFENLWISHPDPQVDLCALPVDCIYKAAQALGHKIFIKTLNCGNIPNEEQIKSLDAVEDVFMIGYPDGIWDNKNNLPITRKGITATPYIQNFQGDKNFLIDMAVFPGSSGSPVMLVNSGSYHDKTGMKLVFGNRIYLLGIVHKVFQHQIDGEIKAVPISTSSKLVVNSLVPNNLGIVIKSERLLDFYSNIRNKRRNITRRNIDGDPKGTRYAFINNKI